MEIPTLTLEELKTIAAIMLNTSYRLGDAAKIIPIYEKIYNKIITLEPPKEANHG